MKKPITKVSTLLWTVVGLWSALVAHASHPTIVSGIQEPKTDTITVQALQAKMRSGANVQLIDVRLVKDRKADPRLLPTAIWKDPEQVDVWAKTLSKNAPVVVYCVHGHRISQQVESRLAQLGFSVQRLAGGIEAWKAAGGQTVSLP